MTDLELQMWCAENFPLKLEAKTITPSAIGTNQNDKYQVIWWRGQATAVLPTEWNCILYQMEEMLTSDQWPTYLDLLDLAGTGHPDKRIAHADWQTRAKALKQLWNQIPK